MPARQNQDDFNAQDAANLFSNFQRLDPRMQMIIVALLVIAGIVFFIAYTKSRHGSSAPPAGYAQMLLGNPSDATDSPSNHDNFLMIKPYFALSFNDSKGTPNWVSWQVTAGNLGKIERKKTFDPDTTLPIGFNQIVTRDYNNSGFDRGHMCPHSDRAANNEMSNSTFVMTNIIPQAPNVNRKAWEQLESYGRDLVTREHDRLYIIAGPAGKGGRGSRGERQTLANGKVTVPAACWKIIVVVPEAGGSDDLAKLSTSTRVITVLMPNDDDAVGEQWAPFRTSPGEVENKTGLHFFDRVKPQVASAWRTKVDRETIPPARARYYPKEN
ncbi:MAG TPA: DNA/RNA non-specific endonuclease [Tepidisphaeraceae bacterium]|jgi:endonuclease G|nr:DNA/RNA non-specific endonuclease [Tepidisphaeraceae bacterium]